MNNGPFTPTGPTYLVGATPVQCISTNNAYPISYRVRNLTTTNAYITWTNSSQTAPSITAVAPSAGTPSSQTLGMFGSSIETFSLMANGWFQASAGATFEVTPGEGV